MLFRGMLIGVWVAALSSCDNGLPNMPSTGDSTPTLAGSCNFAADGRCDDYAEVQADTGTAQACGNMGGEWASKQCPLDGRAAVCTESAPATRTYAYGTVAATALASSCPAGKLLQLEGACDKPMRNTCDEYMGAHAGGNYMGAHLVPGEAATQCTTAGGTWTSGGSCAKEGRSASCASNAPATFTYAYGAPAADKLAMSCMAADFKRIGTAPPPKTSDEDAGH
jgi:hypothetical protein